MTTPMRRQYLQLKKQFPDAILLFRLGDFYETFDRDAQIVSQVCDIVLTSRPVGKNARVPLAGVPHHAVEGYIAKLIHAGYKVAIAEQSDETTHSGLMIRAVTEVITPGTVLEPSLLETTRNNYLAAVIVEKDRAGIAYTDITTGEFATTQIARSDPISVVIRELDRLHPVECLVPDTDDNFLKYLEASNEQGVHFSPYEDWHFELDNARTALLEQFGVASLEGYGCDHLPLAIQAAGAVVQYLRETRKAVLRQMSLTTYSLDDFMILDPTTRRNLELIQTIRERKAKGALLGVLDLTATPMGSRLLKQWLNRPLLDLARLNARLDAVDTFYRDTATRAHARSILKTLGDMERLANRAAQQIATPRDLLSLQEALQGISELKRVLGGLPESVSALRQAVRDLDACEEVVLLVQQAISPDATARPGAGGIIAAGFSAELDNLRSAAHQAKEWISQLERVERKRTGIKNLRVGYNKVFGYYIEISKAQLKYAPSDYIRKQTLVNAERFITPELKEKEALVLSAEERLIELEMQIYRQVCEQVASYGNRMLRTARAAAELDCYISFAEVAASNRYVRPNLNEGDRIEIIAGRHPVVEQMLGPENFVPNSIVLGPEEKILVITGPNMAGKSTILRSCALIVLMAQIGSFVPADAATIGLVDRIFTRVGAQDDIAAGQSTFMVEMVEVANILNNATSKSLLILDEVGRGTSTYDGISLAWAVVEYIHNHPRLRAKTLFATHYHELTALENILPYVRNYNVAVQEEGDRIVFLHKLVPGSADRSYGIHVAQLAGLPKPVIHRAEEILEQLERQSDGTTIQSGKVRQAQQLPLFSAKSRVLADLESLDVMSMTPLEALNKLFELQQKARKEG